MKTIAICNLKGGVAKTTTVVNLAADLAHDHGKRVLVIDADSQGNTTEFLTDELCTRSLADLLRLPKTERTPFSLSVLSGEAIRPTRIPCVSVLGADDSLMDLDLSKVEDGSVYVSCLRDLLQAKALPYDIALIDCPPAFNAASTAALLAADEVLIPIKLDAFALRGMSNMLRQIENMRKINPALRVAGVLPVMWYQSEGNTNALSVLQASGLPVFHRIRRSTMVDAMTYTQRPLIQCSPTSGACRDYRALATRIAEGRY